MNKSNIEKLHPMAIGLLSSRIKDFPVSKFIYSAYNIVKRCEDSDSNVISDKWISDINRWCEVILEGMTLDPSALPFSISDSIKKENISVFKIGNRPYGGHPSIILKDEDGWKYWMVCPEAFELFQVGDLVSISGVVRDIGDGIVFLTVPNRVVKEK